MSGHLLDQLCLHLGQLLLQLLVGTVQGGGLFFGRAAQLGLGAANARVPQSTPDNIVVIITHASRAQ